MILLLFNSSDLKNSNNSLYNVEEPTGRGDAVVLVRDLGYGARQDRASRADPQRASSVFDGIPSSRVSRNEFVVFDYRGWHQELFRGRITPEDAAWAGDLMARVSDAQWDAAFSAGGYDPAVAARFKAALKSRIEQARRVYSSRSFNAETAGLAENVARV